MIKRWLKQKISEHYPDLGFDVLAPPNEKMGDYSTNIAFVTAKKEGKDPMKVGEGLVFDLSKDKDFTDVFEKIEAIKPGFVNFFLKREFIQKQLEEIYKKLDSFGRSEIGKGRTVIVEYGGTNIAKPMHVGHLRSTIIGDGLANVHKFLGWKVIRWNYIGDWGTQFGNLIAAYNLWGDDNELKKNPIQTMLDLYVKFHGELKNNPDLEFIGREEFKKLEEGDSENRKLWETFRDYSLEEFDKIFRQLDIKFDITKGEGGYEAAIDETVEFIRQKGILKKSEGADIVEPEGLPPALIRKSDGTSLYLTRDIASLKERIEKYDSDKILYVVANQQALHFEQLFAIAGLLGFAKAVLVHVKFGMVLGEDGKKLATREGKIIPLQEVIDKIVALAGKVVKEKNPELSEKQTDEIAKAIGIGALKYNDLKQHPHTDVIFDWKAMLDISGNSGPYLQYTYARLNNIIEKAENWKAGDATLLTEPKEEKLMKKILEFPEAVENCAETNALNGLALYLYELSNKANGFYESVRVLDDENVERRNARLVLVITVAVILKRGLGLLGIGVLKRI
jgi:arginyl-tRNA synthetase